MNDQQYFFIDNFLDTDLVSAIATEKTKLATIETLPDNCGHFINPDGIVVDDSTHPNIYNRYHDNSMLKSLLTKSVVNLIDKIRVSLTPYLNNPVIYNYATLPSLKMNVKETSGGWHKDYNPIENFDDATKQWITFFTLSSDDVNSEFQVSHTSEWPDVWKRGIKETLSDNRLFAHNMNLGHQYHQNDKNDVTLIYIRWYDNLIK